MLRDGATGYEEVWVRIRGRLEEYLERFEDAWKPSSEEVFACQSSPSVNGPRVRHTALEGVRQGVVEDEDSLLFHCRCPMGELTSRRMRLKRVLESKGRRS